MGEVVLDAAEAAFLVRAQDQPQALAQRHTRLLHGQQPEHPGHRRPLVVNRAARVNLAVGDLAPERRVRPAVALRHDIHMRQHADDLRPLRHARPDPLRVARVAVQVFHRQPVLTRKAQRQFQRPRRLGPKGRTGGRLTLDAGDLQEPLCLLNQFVPVGVHPRRKLLVNLLKVVHDYPDPHPAKLCSHYPHIGRRRQGGREHGPAAPGPSRQGPYSPKSQPGKVLTPSSSAPPSAS